MEHVEGSVDVVGLENLYYSMIHRLEDRCSSLLSKLCTFG